MRRLGVLTVLVAMASGGMTPGPAAMPVLPIVKTRKKVPMNSVQYLRMVSPRWRHTIYHETHAQ